MNEPTTTNNVNVNEPTTDSDSDSSDIPVWDYSDEDFERNSEAVPFSIGNRVKVYWPGTKCWYEGVVNDVDQSDMTYEVHYHTDNQYIWHDLTWKVQLLKQKKNK